MQYVGEPKLVLIDLWLNFNSFLFVILFDSAFINLWMDGNSIYFGLLEEQTSRRNIFWTQQWSNKSN